MGDLQRSSSGNATVSEEELDLKSIRVDRPGSSGIMNDEPRQASSLDTNQKSQAKEYWDRTRQKQDVTESWQGYFSKTELI